MSSFRRAINILLGVGMLLCSVLLFCFPEQAYILVILFMAVGLILSGFKRLIYYFTLARYMVDGMKIFFKALLLIDFGLFVFSLNELPLTFAMLCLIGGLIFSGAMGVMHAYDARKLDSHAWKYELIYGAGQITLSAVGLFFLHSVRIMSILFGFGLAQSAVSRISAAFRKTAIAYVEWLP